VGILIDAGSAGTFMSDGTTLIGSRPPSTDHPRVYRFLTISGGKLDYTHALLREEAGDTWLLSELSSSGVWLADPGPGMPSRLLGSTRLISGDRFKCGSVWFTVVIIPTAITWKTEQVTCAPDES
jgi:hypothetical protein